MMMTQVTIRLNLQNDWNLTLVTFEFGKICKTFIVKEIFEVNFIKGKLQSWERKIMYWKRG